MNNPNPRHILLDFERSLSPLFREVSLLGEIPLSDDEEGQIQATLRQLLRLDGPGAATQFLQEETPCTLACFLVWKGIRGYREGDYWAEVCHSVGLPQANWPQRWGEIFVEVLQRLNLPTFRESGGHRFVTPILIHGGIPNYCLDDFFEHLIWPAVTGKLDYDGTVSDLLTEWQERPSLTLFTDKPVRRFLEQGGKVAADFLQRCLDMASQAYDAGLMPSAKDLGLPEHVVERFAAWLRNVSPETSSRTPRQSEVVRYRVPEIFLNVSAGCLQLSFPSQKLLRNKLDSVHLELEVRQQDSLLATIALSGVGKGEWIETSPCDVDLGVPGEQYQITLLSGKKPLRRWSFPGMNEDKPWMAFHGSSGKLLREQTIDEEDFWIVFPSSWELTGTGQVLESSPIGRACKAEHVCSEGGVVEDLRLTHADGRSFSLPLEWKSTPTLSDEGILTWPRVSSGDFTVYVGAPPELHIPLGSEPDNSRIFEYVHVTITPMGEAWPAERRDIPLRSLAEIVQRRGRYLSLPLGIPQLLSHSPCGRFSIEVRGRLGQDKTFHLCFLPEINFNFPPVLLLPNPAIGLQEFSFLLECPRIQKLAADPPAEVVPQSSTSYNEAQSYRVVVSTESEQIVLRPRFSVGKRTVEVPLEIAVPRLCWTVSGLNNDSSLHWRDRTLVLSLQELEGASEPRLLVQGDFCQDLACALILQGAEQRNRFALKNGKGGCPLSPFLDSLRESGLSKNHFHLEFSLPGEDRLRSLHLLEVQTRWIVEDLQIEQELVPSEDKRVVLLVWRDKGNVKNRVLRLWNLSSRSGEPIEVIVEDGRSDVLIEKNLVDFPDGRYCFEFATVDPWAEVSPLVSPDPCRDELYFFEVREKIKQLDARAIKKTALLERYCQECQAREEKYGDGLVLFQQKFQQGAKQQDIDIAAETLAGVLLNPDYPVKESAANFLGRLFLHLGFLNRRWGPNMKQLLLMKKAYGCSEAEKPPSSSSAADSDNSLQAYRMIADLYTQATWQSSDAERRFNFHCYSIHGALSQALCFIATLQRAAAYDVLYIPEHVLKDVNWWGNFFYHNQEQEYKEELLWAEETFAC